MMKHWKTFGLALLAALAVLITACNPEQPLNSTGNEPVESSEAVESSSEKVQDAADLSEEAMENFIRKVQAGNYVVDCDTFVKTYVCSEDLVYLDYVYDVDYLDTIYDGLAVMTVNGQETFMGFVGEESVGDVLFLGEGKARDFVSEGNAIPEFHTALLDSWFREDVSDGNIWNLFYNDTQDPLTFLSNSDAVKASMQNFAGINQNNVKRMQGVYLVLDAIDPTEAHLKTTFTEGYPALNDLDIKVTFGNAEANPIAAAWMEDPNRAYPEARTEWGVDVICLNSVFLPDYGEKAVPFPAFATYAFKLDEGAILREDKVIVRDCKATESGMEAYAAELINEGFTPVTEDGTTYYRLLLREEYHCWSSISLEYDNGVNLIAEKYYEFPEYEGLDAVNEVLTGHGYEPLPESAHLSNVRAVDTKDEMTESWLYFFNYDLVLYVDLDYDDRDEIEAYLEAYVDSLGEAYQPATEDDYEEASGEIEEERILGLKASLEALFDENNYYKNETREGVKTFRFHFDEEEDRVTLLFKGETYVPTETIGEKLTGLFPEVDLSNMASARDLTKMQKTMYGRDYPFCLSLSMSFSSAEEAVAWLEEYIAVITDEANGFDITSASAAETNKARAYVKEEENGMTRLFAFDYEEGWTSVMVEFRYGRIE